MFSLYLFNLHQTIINSAYTQILTVNNGKAFFVSLLFKLVYED